MVSFFKCHPTLLLDGTKFAYLCLIFCLRDAASTLYFFTTLKMLQVLIHSLHLASWVPLLNIVIINCCCYYHYCYSYRHRYCYHCHYHQRQVKTNDIISRRFGDLMTPLSRVQMRINLPNASSRLTTDLHNGGGYTNTLTRIESVCAFKFGVNCLM